ncbi:hypothetical protein V7x_54710 [Crateriforma conspicua]|uniref:Uncharacterized protein n=1 Tax=Crateriforma conspicua TaxID=2527996 RepID=A0A5C6FFX3_9PLAN|nr:hypothetical protein V7x_54710 [Crateriforma conspicua]
MSAGVDDQYARTAKNLRIQTAPCPINRWRLVYPDHHATPDDSSANTRRESAFSRISTFLRVVFRSPQTYPVNNLSVASL